MTTDSGQKLMLNVDDLAWREVGDELVVLEVATTMYLTLNGSAKALWELLVDGATTSELSAALQERYGIDAERADSDVAQFLAVLRERSLLRAAD